jgi:hypothetical protein
MAASFLRGLGCRSRDAGSFFKPLKEELEPFEHPGQYEFDSSGPLLPFPFLLFVVYQQSWARSSHPESQEML